jgi:predicted amidohydrolase YtcJ
MKKFSFIFSSLLVLSIGCREVSSSDWVLHNANIMSIDSAFSQAEAMVIAGDSIIAIGTNEEILSLAQSATQITDVQGKTIVPGFIDAHCHPRPIYSFESIHGQVNVNPAHTPTMEDLIAELRRKANITPKGTWIFGGRYQHTKLGRHPTRHDLDLASKDHPISIRHSSGHISVVNTKALALAGITRETKDPPGGAFDRDPDGMPNGVCRESAYKLVSNLAPKPAQPSQSEQKEGLRKKLEDYVRNGITSISEAGIDIEKFRLYEEMAEEGLPLRIQVMLREYVLDTALSLGLVPGYGDDWLRINAVKFYHGNSLSGQTCWLYEPYDKINPVSGKKDYYGIPPARSQSALDSLVAKIHQDGFQAAIHANGDREIEMVLDAIEKALTQDPQTDHRHRIEHGSVTNQSILERMKTLGIVYAPHSYVYEHGDKMKVYGPQRWDWMHANKSAIDLGIPVAGNSDEPVSPAQPMLRIQSMVTRTTAEGEEYGPKQKGSVEKALQIWTLGSAFALFAEEELGSLEKGKKADFVLLDQNPLQTDAFHLKDIEILGTAIGGKWVFQKEGIGQN